ERAAEWAGADEVAASLPIGYETELTRRFEEGVDLSGGQWQKVALARGFMRDAALGILDEPTAALDAAAEERLFHRFRALAASGTGGGSGERDWGRQDDSSQTLVPLLRAERRTEHGGRRRHPAFRRGCLTRAPGRHLPGLRPVRVHGARDGWRRRSTADR